MFVKTHSLYAILKVSLVFLALTLLIPLAANMNFPLWHSNVFHYSFFELLLRLPDLSLPCSFLGNDLTIRPNCKWKEGSTKVFKESNFSWRYSRVNCTLRADIVLVVVFLEIFIASPSPSAKYCTPSMANCLVSLTHSGLGVGVVVVLGVAVILGVALVETSFFWFVCVVVADWFETIDLKPLLFWICSTVAI